MTEKVSYPVTIFGLAIAISEVAVVLLWIIIGIVIAAHAVPNPIHRPALAATIVFSLHFASTVALFIALETFGVFRRGWAPRKRKMFLTHHSDENTASGDETHVGYMASWGVAILVVVFSDIFSLIEMIDIVEKVGSGSNGVEIALFVVNTWGLCNTVSCAIWSIWAAIDVYVIRRN